MNRIHVFIVIALVLVVGAYVTIPWLLYQTYVQPHLHAFESYVDGNLTALRSDQAAIAAAPRWWEGGGAADAGAELNGRVAWTDGEKHDICAGPCDLRLPLLASARWEELDFGWLAELNRFGSWNIHIGAASEIGTRSAIAYRRPSYKQLQAWARLRLLKGLNTGEMTTASQDVRQLARLMYAQGDLPGAYAAISVLDSERKFYDELSNDKKPIPTGWKPLKREVLDQERRACLAVGSLFQLATPTAVVREVYQDNGMPFCRCAGIVEYLANQAWISRGVRRAFSDERSRNLDAVVASRSAECSLAPVVAGSMVPNEFSKDFAKFSVLEKAGWVARPLQRLLGGVLVTMKVPDPFKHYAK